MTTEARDTGGTVRADRSLTGTMLRCSLLLLPLALIACDRQPAAPTAKAPVETGYIAKVLALPEGQRDGVLFRAVLSGGGEACQGVRSVETLPAAPDGHPNWRVTCPDGSQWLVNLADDGTAVVTGARTR